MKIKITEHPLNDGLFAAVKLIYVSLCLKKKMMTFVKFKSNPFRALGAHCPTHTNASRFHLVDESSIIFPQIGNNFVIFNAPENMNFQFNTKFSMTNALCSHNFLID